MALLLLACTDWKSKYWQAQMELERCQSSGEKTEILVEPQTIVTEEAPQQDTIFLPVHVPGVEKTGGEAQQNKQAPRAKVSKLQYRKQYSFFMRRDSVKIWLTIANSVQQGKLIQAVHLDSVQYPSQIRTRIRTVTVVPEGYWPLENIIKWGGGFLLIIFAILLTMLIKSRR